MEECVAPELRDAAIAVMSQPGFFRDLPPMEGAIKAVEEMIERGFSVLICTSPLPSNPTCPQDKIEWVRKHLGHIDFRDPGVKSKRLDAQDIIVMTRDKTFVAGDVLIDDKPLIQGCMRPTWEHIVFGAPYNALEKGDERLRIDDWTSWQAVLAKRLSPFSPVQEELLKAASGLPSSASETTLSASSALSPRTPETRPTTAEDVRSMRDFSKEIPYLKAIREDYLRWRTGGAAGMKGNIDSADALKEMIKELEDAAAQKDEDSGEEDPGDVFVWRKQTQEMYRKQYAKWRKGKSQGASSTTLGLSPDARRSERALF